MKTILTLTILASDIKSTYYGNARDCAITRALSRAGRPELTDCGQGINNTNLDVRFESYNIKGYNALRKHVLQSYRNKREYKSYKNMDAIFTISFDESVFSNRYEPQVSLVLAKLRKIFLKIKSFL